jgi:flagellar hook-basal body complex protein FliE
MNIASISNLTDFSKYGAGSLSTATENKTASFDSLYQAAVNLVNETNSYSDAAEKAETAYSLGLNDSTSDLLVAQQKANLSLQYTVAVRNNVLDAYKEIMNLQF